MIGDHRFMSRTSFASEPRRSAHSITSESRTCWTESRAADMPSGFHEAVGVRTRPHTIRPSSTRSTPSEGDSLRRRPGLLPSKPSPVSTINLRRAPRTIDLAFATPTQPQPTRRRSSSSSRRETAGRVPARLPSASPVTNHRQLLAHCPRNVPELLLLTGLELSLERKQMPQVVENVENECSG